MENVYQHFKSLILSHLAKLGESGVMTPTMDTARIIVEPPRDVTHGELSTNAAMVLATQVGKKPRELAEDIAAFLKTVDSVRDVEIAGPGFVNWRLQAHTWYEVLKTLLGKGDTFGDSTIGGGAMYNIEFVSANPTGPLTVAHARGAVIGDALAALLEKVGYAVVREYYMNDTGNQVDILARSTYLRYLEALGQEIGEIPSGMYPGDYLKDIGAALARRDGDTWVGRPEGEWLAVFREFAIDTLVKGIKEDLAALGITHSIFSSEHELVEKGAVDAAYNALKEKGLIYEGVLEPPKGKVIEDWEPRPQTLFRATEFGDDVDRPLKKSDGTWTYFANDIAYHYDKYQRGYLRQVDVLGADHGGYVKRIQAAVKALTDGAGQLDVLLCQMVKIIKGGEEVRMSKRMGQFVTLRDLLEEVNKDIVRFIMLTRRSDMALDFNLDKVLEESKDNPVFYVQYAHARICSVERHAQEMFKDHLIDADWMHHVNFSRLSEPEEIALIRKLADYPRLIESAAQALEPHRVAFYVTELAAHFHALWNKGKDDATLRFLIQEDEAVSLARLALLEGVRYVIASGLQVMGVTAKEEMR